MPIFEYVCEDCNRVFEALVRGSQEPECPQCHGRRLKQQISVFAVGAPRSASSATANGGCGAPSCCMGTGSCADE